MRSQMISLLVLISYLAAPYAVAEDDSRPWDQQPFLGLGTRDTSEGLVVSWIFPGPLGGRSFTSESGVQRADNVVSLDGQKVDRDAFRKQIASKSPGDSVTLVFRRSPESQTNSSVPKGGAGGEEFSLTVELSSRDLWAGTIKRGLNGRSIDDPTMGEFEKIILDKAQSVGIHDADGGVKSLVENLAVVQETNLDSNSLPAVVNVFRRPLSIDAVESKIAARVAKVNSISAVFKSDDLNHVSNLFTQTLDLPDSSSDFANALSQSVKDQLDWQAWDKAMGVVKQMRNDWSIQTELAGDHIRVIRMSSDAAGPIIAAHIDAMKAKAYAWESKVNSESMATGDPVSVELIPAALAKAVEGEILAFELDENKNYCVLGGAGKNVYDMSKIASVVDIGGDDRYEYPSIDQHAATSASRNQTIVDLKGNDSYESKGDFFGPATGVFGYSLIDDRGGDDTYSTHGQFGIGAGLFGVGVLIDRAGNDRYDNKGAGAGFTMGVGYYGAGLILDKSGGDTYIGEKLCQGMGGPRGFGAIVDSSGNDIYRANGPSFGSAYGTPAVYLGMSQGFGFGIRGYAAGGVGAIYDLGGSDKYEAGEFSQAGGYFYGLGILHDSRGNDLYYGNRYGQGFAAHQAAGILIDDSGDDTYWSMTAANQAGTWDQSIGMLVDRSGNDAYRCDGLGQGGASMQAIALFLDLDGNDRYSSNAGSVLGQSGSNTYHYDQDRVFSFSLFLDQGEGNDVYSGGNHQPPRKNNTTFKTGSLNKEVPENSSLYGVFADGRTEPSMGAEAPFREWTDERGKYRVVARLVGKTAKIVQLEKKDGTKVDVSISKLSQKDREYLRGH